MNKKAYIQPAMCAVQLGNCPYMVVTSPAPLKIYDDSDDTLVDEDDVI